MCAYVCVEKLQKEKKAQKRGKNVEKHSSLFYQSAFMGLLVVLIHELTWPLDRSVALLVFKGKVFLVGSRGNSEELM